MNREKHNPTCLPAAPSRSDITKAGAMPDAKSLGSTKIFLKQWETQNTWNWCEEVMGFYMDLFFHKTKTSLRSTKPNLTPMPKNFVHTQDQSR